jgi:hypothetical protein
MTQTKAKRKSRRKVGFPNSIGSLGLAEIQQIVCAMECSGDARRTVRLRLAARLGVAPNVIDWCSAHRTRALRKLHARELTAWPFHLNLSGPVDVLLAETR